jgi:ketosteroid isomerase-like protein
MFVNAAPRSGEELITAYLQAVTRKDASVVDDFFHPDVEYVVNGTEMRDREGALPIVSRQCLDALPWLGLHRGRRAVKDFLAHMHRNLEVIAFGTRVVIAEGDKAAAFGWFRLHALSTGRTVDIPYSIMLELRNGLIVKYHFLENTFDVALAFRIDGEWLLDIDSAQHRAPRV